MKRKLPVGLIGVVVAGLVMTGAVGAQGQATARIAATAGTATNYGLWLPLHGGSNYPWVVGCTWNNGCSNGYHGYFAIDFARNSSGSIAGDPVYAARNGTASIDSIDGGGGPRTCSSSGNAVVVDHGGGLKTCYLHLKSIAFSGSIPVTPFTVIGYVGATGNTKPGYNHLHFEVRLNGARVSASLYGCVNGTKVRYPNNWGNTDWDQVSLWRQIKSDGPWCAYNAIQSAANLKWVSAELDYGASLNGMLRARSGAISTWERFRFIGECDRMGPSLVLIGCLIQSTANGRYIAAELSYAGSDQYMLRARTTTPGSWERFWLKGCDSTAGCFIKSLAAGKYTAAELGYGTSNARYGMLRARTDPANVGTWERFRLGSG